MQRRGSARPCIVESRPRCGPITVRVWQEGQQLALEGRDTGIGIAPAELERIFDRVYEVDGWGSREYGGVGLSGEADEGSAFSGGLPLWEE